MSTLFNLIKIDLISYFNFYKILNAKGFKNKIKETFKFLFVIAVFLIFAVYVYLFANLSIDGFKELNASYILLGEFFALSSVFVLLTSIFRVDSIFFRSKDYDLLRSMPIKKITIVLSKIINLYLANLIFTMVIMIPTMIVYVLNIAVTWQFYLLFIFSLLIIPLIPTIIGIIIGSLISFITSRLPFKKIFQFIFMLSILIGYFYLSFKNMTFDNLNLANLGQSFVNIFNKVYPLTNIYIDLLISYKIKSILIFIIIPLVLFILAISFLTLIFDKVIIKINRQVKNKHYVLKNYKVRSPIIAIMHKELKKYINSPMIVLNVCFSIILLVIAVVAFFILGPDTIFKYLEIPNLKNIIISNGPLYISLILLMCSTTASSISLEGKNIWIIKSLPLKIKEIFLGKILFNVLLLIIPGFLASIGIVYLFNLNIYNLLLYFLTILINAFLISFLGLIINLHFPFMIWDNEVKVVKQSLASFLTLFIGLILGIIPLVVDFSIYIIDGIYFIITIILMFYLFKVGPKLFQKIG